MPEADSEISFTKTLLRKMKENIYLGKAKQCELIK